MGWFDKRQRPGCQAIPQQPRVNHREARKDGSSEKAASFVHPIHKLPQKVAHSKVRDSKSGVVFEGERSANATTPSLKKEARRLPVKRLSETPQRQLWDTDSDGSNISEGSVGLSRKKQRTHKAARDRIIANPTAFRPGHESHTEFVHASSIANNSKAKSYKLAFPQFPDLSRITLQYPGAPPPEIYELVIPISQDDFKSLEEIREVIEITIDKYFPPDYAAAMMNESTGMVRRLKRASQRLAGEEYYRHIEEWNHTVRQLRTEGKLEQMIDSWDSVDLKLCEMILNQTYARTVSLGVNDLKRYTNGEDNVYGELLPKFVSRILREDTKLRADHVFVDLGSGVGNVVLQAALEVGCESWGCEMMPNACKLADLQKAEFEARCKLWGLSNGEVHLEKGDFLTHEAINKVLPRADVVLVNNQAFTPQLNESLTNLFLDLKDGARVVSLKSFAPMGPKGQQHPSKNPGATYNMLRVTEKRYFSRSVSWTDAHGTYYVATKDSSRISTIH